jgi:sulfite reductase (NADPH) flavoprotein alpha-component
MTISRTNPFPAIIRERYLLTKEGSTKETYHLVLDLKDSGMVFKVGDSVGIYAQNDPQMVESYLQALHATGDEAISEPRTEKPTTLRAFLRDKANLSRLNNAFLQLLDPNHPLLSDKAAAADKDPLDVLRPHTHTKLPLQQLAATFAPLLPRFYSVASSPKAYPDEVHLTVSLSSYTHHGEKRYGVASHFLCNLAEIASTPIPTYVQPIAHFTLPQNDAAPIIMIGPGTGVAPFRGFLQERMIRKAPGQNWLFFGERNRASDFYYEKEWQVLVDNHHLRLDTAFSRDQVEKVYVQHKMLENGSDLWKWIEEGAYTYVCGEADPMAKGVETTLLHIFQDYGNLSETDAKAYLKKLRTEKRYLVDVY